MTFRTGDAVLHVPSGETWVLAAVKGEHVYPGGWPGSRALAADCVLVEAATDDTHAAMWEGVAQSCGEAGAIARAQECGCGGLCDSGTRCPMRRLPKSTVMAMAAAESTAAAETHKGEG